MLLVSSKELLTEVVEAVEAVETDAAGVYDVATEDVAAAEDREEFVTTELDTEEPGEVALER